MTDYDLLDSKFVATAAAQGARILNAVRLRRIQVWAANSSASTARTLAVEFTTNANAGMGDDSKVFSDTALGVTDIAHVDCRPPKNAYASFWHSVASGAANNELFNITCPTQSIVDVTFDVALIDDEAVNFVNRVVAAATVGTLYTSPLDASNAGGTPGTSALIPLFVNTI